jgi:hypothetical protein
MIHVNKEQIEDLYLKQNLSREKCLSILKISESAFKRFCRKNNIKKSKEARYKMRKRTCLEKYGVDHVSKLASVKAKREQTCLERYGVDNAAKSKEVKEKAEQTCLERYKGKSPMSSKIVQEKVKTALKLTLESGIPQQKRKRTCLEKYGVDSYSKTSIHKTLVSKANRKASISGIPQQKRKLTCLEKYGVDHPAKMADHLRKCNRTKFLNNTFHTSKPEEDAYKILVEKFGSEDVLRQYRSEVYPFNCDFYIKSLDLYIECQFSHFHYKEPFDMNKLDHLKRLEDLKQKELEHRSKQKSVYTSMIYTWTESDPLKRKTAKENNLNWIEFFNMKELKDELQQLYLKTN